MHTMRPPVTSLTRRLATLADWQRRAQRLPRVEQASGSITRSRGQKIRIPARNISYSFAVRNEAQKQPRQTSSISAQSDEAEAQAAPAAPPAGGFGSGPFTTGSSVFDALLTTVVGLSMGEFLEVQ